jgi:hypothetical protein
VLRDWIELHVIDHGTGFADDYLPRAFERFSRPTAARSGGAGLGLALVEAVAHAHGGEAGAANAPSGTDVWLTLPLARPPRPSTRHATEAPECAVDRQTRPPTRARVHGLFRTCTRSSTPAFALGASAAT